MVPRKTLKLFGSPLKGDSESRHLKDDLAQGHRFSSLHRTATNASFVPFKNNDLSFVDDPKFHRHAEATSNELFYDLFFVANLTTFTSLLQINSGTTLTAYIGFFCLLWFTWYQVSLYDVRFSSDSVFDRVCKAIQFGVMVGFAVMGPQWKPGQAVEKSDFNTFRAFTIILIGSRLILILQYASTIYFTWRFRRTRLPLLLIVSSYLAAAIVYGSLAALINIQTDVSTGKPVPNGAYIGWYVIVVVETLLITAISCRWRVISFKGTHLVQRMSLLTLIVLGEGIIVVCKAISGIVKNYYVFTGSVVGQIAAAILTIYLLYMLYFDRLEEAEDHFGTIRQQVWAFLHFPLHITLVLVLQGVAQFINWRQAISGFNMVMSDLHHDFNQTYATAQDFAKQINSTAWNEVFQFLPKGYDVEEEGIVNESLALYVNLWTDSSPAAIKSKQNALHDLVNALQNIIVESMGIAAPKVKEKVSSALSVEQETEALYKVFDLVFIYFFVTGGLALIIMGTLACIVNPPKGIREYIRSGANFAVGLGLCLLSLMHFTYGGANLSMSPWVLPLFCLSLTLVIACNHIPSSRKNKAGHGERQKRKGSQGFDFDYEELKGHITSPPKTYKKNRKEVIIQVGHLEDGPLLHSGTA